MTDEGIPKLGEGDLKDLILKAKSGDNEAFGILFETFYTPVFRYAYLRLNSKEDSEDVAQIVFEKAFMGLDRYSDKGQGSSLLNYLFTIARNTIIDKHRKNKEIPVDSFSENTIPHAKENPDRMVEVSIETARVSKALAKLPIEQQDAIILRLVNGLSNVEIANVLNKKEGTVRQLQSRGLKKIRKDLQNE